MFRRCCLGPFATLFLFVGFFGFAGPAAAQPAATDATPDFTRLANPELAERLQLTDEQRAQIAQLLQRRADAQANPDQDQRDQQQAEIDSQLADVLNAEQKQRFARSRVRPS